MIWILHQQIKLAINVFLGYSKFISHNKVLLGINSFLKEKSQKAFNGVEGREPFLLLLRGFFVRPQTALQVAPRTIVE
jgi:hypothetical protein